MILSRDAQIFIEITEQRELDKVRQDVNKLQTARDPYLAEHQSFPRCFCVVNGSITRSMQEAGEAINISDLSSINSRTFFSTLKSTLTHVLPPPSVARLIRSRGPRTNANTFRSRTY
jgi:hypothetical protein